MKSKKARIEISILIALLLGVSVFVVSVVFLVPNLLGKSKAEASYNIGSTEDFDQDGIQNYFDKCKCTAAETENGCLSGINADDTTHNPYKDCPPEMCPPWKPKTVSCI